MDLDGVMTASELYIGEHIYAYLVLVPEPLEVNYIALKLVA